MSRKPIDSSSTAASKPGVGLLAWERNPDRARRRAERRTAARIESRRPTGARAAQAAFAETGGLHTTGLFDASGELLCVREDVGRHNAMDKVVGWAFREGRLPLTDAVLCVSGRLSFELVQKAAVAGCPILVAVGAPSSLAIELGGAQRITLCGFVREGRVNVYTEPNRID
jgi:FdhD protein